MASMLGLCSQCPRLVAFPDRPIRLVVPFLLADPLTVLRAYTPLLYRSSWARVSLSTTRLGREAIGSMEVVKRSAADGYTLLFGTASTHGLYNLIQPNAQYDAIEDFSYVGVLGGAPVVFVVNPGMPKTLKTLVIASRLNPGKYNYGSPWHRYAAACGD